MINEAHILVFVVIACLFFACVAMKKLLNNYPCFASPMAFASVHYRFIS